MTETLLGIVRYSPLEIVTTGTISTFSSHDTSSYVFTGAGAVTIESISYGAKGKTLKLINLTGSTLTLKHNTGSVSKNRIVTFDSADLVVSNDQIVNLFYDHINSRWKVDGATSGSGGGGGKVVTAVQVGPSAYTAAANEIVRVDSTANAFSVVLPGSPADGAEIEIVDVGGAAATNNITIDRSGNTINGVPADVAFDVNFDRAVLIFSTSLGWSLT